MLVSVLSLVDHNPSHSYTNNFGTQLYFSCQGDRMPITCEVASVLAGVTTFCSVVTLICCWYMINIAKSMIKKTTDTMNVIANAGHIVKRSKTPRSKSVQANMVVTRKPPHEMRPENFVAEVVEEIVEHVLEAVDESTDQVEVDDVNHEHHIIAAEILAAPVDEEIIYENNDHCHYGFEPIYEEADNIDTNEVDPESEPLYVRMTIPPEDCKHPGCKK